VRSLCSGVHSLRPCRFTSRLTIRCMCCVSRTGASRGLALDTKPLGAPVRKSPRKRFAVRSCIPGQPLLHTLEVSAYGGAVAYELL